MSQRPLTLWTPQTIAGVFTDVDDTLTESGRLSAQTLAAMERLTASGRRLIPVTGRSAGWAHMMLLQWPVDAVIAESGGISMYVDPDSGRLIELIHPTTDLSKRPELVGLGQSLIAQFPGLCWASDQDYRKVDVAIDYAEAAIGVTREQLTQAIATIHQAGFSAQASSIHINAWHGVFDKGSAALALLEHLWSGTALANPANWVAIGDAPNDASMFASFETSVLVANGANHKHNWQVAPRWITQQSHGSGFVEMVDHLMRAAA